jgi:hypothetical protein
VFPQLPPETRIKPGKRTINASVRGFLCGVLVAMGFAVSVVAMLLVEDFGFLPGVALAGSGGEQSRGGKQAEHLHRRPL